MNPDPGGCYDHIDFRVRDVASVARFYDALMPALGFRKIHRGTRSRSYYHEDPSMPFFWIVQARRSTPSLSRIAFGAASRKEVYRIAARMRQAGAHRIEGPQICRSYPQPYYAVFFEDPHGNRFEVCCRR